jgi:hypothetical protein
MEEIAGMRKEDEIWEVLREVPQALLNKTMPASVRFNPLTVSNPAPT